MSRLPPLSAVRVFEAAARHESFTRAAAELGMTQSAVSYQIKLLEERLGGALFVRRSGRVVLSDLGRGLAPQVAEAFAILESAFAEADDGASGTLRISVAYTFAARWLLPRLERFRRAHPALDVSIDMDPRIVDLVGEGFDVGVRSGLGGWPGLFEDRLMKVDFTPLLSPALLERMGPLTTPVDLLRLPLISARDTWWSAWFAAAGAPDFDPKRFRGVDLRNQHLEGALALAGEGVSIMQPSLWRAEIADGRLVQPFDLVADEGHHYVLVTSEARRRAPKIRAFRDWVLAEVEADLAAGQLSAR